jgi:CheY-like chemotaxis protein
MANILVVDDEKSIRMLFNYMCSDAGHTVREAENGVQALAALDSFVPDAILLDIAMPEMRGPEFALNLRRLALSLVVKYVMVSLIGIIAMIVVSVGFLKLAGAMSAMAKVQQSHQITMDLGKGGTTEGAWTGLPAPAGSAGPANVALMVGHLAPEVKADFLRKLPPASASDVIINMARIRFVEPEIIAALKEELERRLSGAVGGLDGALEAIENMDLRARMEMIAELVRKQPELAAELRRHVLLPEDLARLSEKEFSLLAGALKPEEWATALFELPDAVRAGLKAQMADRTWQMIEQSMGYGSPSREKTGEALERVLAAAGA